MRVILSSCYLLMVTAAQGFYSARLCVLLLCSSGLFQFDLTVSLIVAGHSHSGMGSCVVRDPF